MSFLDSRLVVEAATWQLSFAGDPERDPEVRSGLGAVIETTRRVPQRK